MVLVGPSDSKYSVVLHDKHMGEVWEHPDPARGSYSPSSTCSHLHIPTYTECPGQPEWPHSSGHCLPLGVVEGRDGGREGGCCGGEVGGGVVPIHVPSNITPCGQGLLGGMDQPLSHSTASLVEMC